MGTRDWASAAGLEIFAGIGSLTAAFREAGVRMYDPWDVKLGGCYDVLLAANSARLKRMISQGVIQWLWLPPPRAGPILLYKMPGEEVPYAVQSFQKVSIRTILL